MKISKKQLFKAFLLWKEDERNKPQDFATQEDCEAENPETLARVSAEVLLGYVEQVKEKKKKKLKNPEKTV
jgi:hypothetical protein